MSHLIAPSLLASDFANLQSECEMINKSDADWYHLDVLDDVCSQYILWNSHYKIH